MKFLRLFFTGDVQLLEAGEWGKLHIDCYGFIKDALSSDGVITIE